jgi:perosamine synthetase
MPPWDVLSMYDLRAQRRDELRVFLTSEGIATRVFFKPMSRQPMYYDSPWLLLNGSRFIEDGLYLPTTPA